jgi:hypothetical protein
VLDALAPAAAEGTHVGLAGLWTDGGLPPVYAAFGNRLRSEVEYIGHFEDEMLRRYEDRDGFVGAVRRAGYDYLVVGRGRPPQPEVDEERWARDAGYERVGESDRLTLWRRG